MHKHGSLGDEHVEGFRKPQGDPKYCAGYRASWLARFFCADLSGADSEVEVIPLEFAHQIGVDRTCSLLGILLRRDGTDMTSGPCLSTVHRDRLTD